MKKILIIIMFAMFCTLDAKEYQVVGKETAKHESASQKRSLFKKVGCDYYNDLEIAHPQFEKIVHREQQQSVIEDGVATEYRSEIEHKTLAPMYLKWISSTVGYGVFAAKPIKAGAMIGVYAGTVRIIKKSGDDVDYAWFYPVNDLENNRIVVDGKFKGNELRFINHSDHPNTTCKDITIDGVYYLIYVANKDIAKDEELTVSYGSGYWSSRDIKPL